MSNKNIILLILSVFINIVFANYSIIDAFPNLYFTDPVDILHPNDNTNRLFVIEQPGKIKVFQNNPYINFLLSVRIIQTI